MEILNINCSNLEVCRICNKAPEIKYIVNLKQYNIASCGITIIENSIEDLISKWNYRNRVESKYISFSEALDLVKKGKTVSHADWGKRSFYIMDIFDKESNHYPDVMDVDKILSDLWYEVK